MSVDQSTMGRRRIWAEFVDYDLLCRGLPDLAAREIQLLLAVTPRELTRLPRMLEQARAAGVEVGLWPMLDDVDGRWMNARNTSAFCRFVESVLRTLPEESTVSEVVFDLEPSIEDLRDLSRFRLSAVASVRSFASRSLTGMEELIRAVRARGFLATVAVLPMVLWDPDGQVGLWQRWLRTPVDAHVFDRVYVMLYSSLLEGYSRGLFSRRDVRWLLHRHVELARHRYGPKTSICLGLVGAGALGDERPYRDPSELRDDIAIVQSAGVNDIALHGYGDPNSMDRWLDGLTSDPISSRLGRSSRAHALVFGARALAAMVTIGSRWSFPRAASR